jgi:hypothetical protein
MRLLPLLNFTRSAGFSYRGCPPASGRLPSCRYAHPLNLSRCQTARPFSRRAPLLRFSTAPGFLVLTASVADLATGPFFTRCCARLQGVAPRGLRPLRFSPAPPALRFFSSSVAARSLSCGSVRADVATFPRSAAPAAHAWNTPISPPPSPSKRLRVSGSVSDSVV